MSILTGDDVAAADLPDWRQLLQALHARFRTGDFATGLALVNRIGALAEAANHHPDVDLRYSLVDVRLQSHDAGGITSRDLALAREISAAAAALDVAAAPAEVQTLEVALDSKNRAGVRPFWLAVLGGSAEASRDEEVVDPTGAVPSLWFQGTDSEEPDRQRFHLDIVVPHDVAQERVAQAVAAGGRLVTDEFAPSFYVLADAEGNQVCVCTWQDRD